MAQSANFKTNFNFKLLRKLELWQKKNAVPNLEAKALDGNPVFTPRQWLERFEQFTKREYSEAITPVLKGEDTTDSKWTGK